MLKGKIKKTKQSKVKFLIRHLFCPTAKEKQELEYNFLTNKVTASGFVCPDSLLWLTPYKSVVILNSDFFPNKRSGKTARLKL